VSEQSSGEAAVSAGTTRVATSDDTYWSVISSGDSPAEQSMTFHREDNAVREAEHRAVRGATAIVLFHSGEQSIASSEVRPWFSVTGYIQGTIIRDLDPTWRERHVTDRNYLDGVASFGREQS